MLRKTLQTYFGSICTFYLQSITAILNKNKATDMTWSNVFLLSALSIFNCFTLLGLLFDVDTFFQLVLVLALFKVSMFQMLT